MNIKVGHLTYKVEYHDTHVMLNSAEVFGECSHNTETIHISHGLSQARERETLLHEIMHAIYHVYGITDEMNEEDTVTRMAMGMTQVLTDNPALLED